MIKVMRASAAYSAAPCLKVAVVGASGAGKTTWAARSPMPLVLLTERQGMASIHHANPEATVIPIDDWSSFVVVWNAIKGARTVEVSNGQVAYEFEIGQTATVQFQTLVIDSVTDLQLLMIDDMSGIKKEDVFDASKHGRITIQTWGRFSEIFRKLFTQQRNAPFSTVFLFLASEKEDEDKRYILANLKGSIVNEFGQYFNVVSHMTAGRALDGSIERRMYFAAGSTALVGTKAAPGWPAYVVNTETPGQTTLGSLHAYSSPSLIGKLPMAEGDDPKWVESLVDAIGEAEDEAKAKAESAAEANGADGAPAPTRRRRR